LKTEKIFNFDIASLRGMAILVVLGYHFFPGKVPWGFVGVDVFFVISGFLITQILTEDIESQSLHEFYAKRVLRIYPSLIIVIFALLISGYLILFDDEFRYLLHSATFGLLQVSNFFEMSNSGYFISTINFRPLLHLWSLGIEFQFYLLFPIVIIFARRRGADVIKTLVAFTLASFFISISFRLFGGLDTFYIPLTRFWEFTLGGVCYLLMSCGYKLKSQQGLLISFLVFIALILVVRPGPEYPGFYALLPTLFALTFILGNGASLIPSWLSRPLVFIAGISYSLYLWHFPLLEFARQSYGVLTVLQRLQLLSATFLLAFATEKFFITLVFGKEKRLQRLVFVSFCLFFLIGATYFGLPHLKRSISARNSEILAVNNFTIDYKFDCKFITGVVDKEDRCNRSVKLGEINHIAIIGDSHSNALTTVFDALSKTEPLLGQYIQMGRGLCPMIPGVGDRSCQDFAVTVKGSIIKNNKVKSVYIAGQWPLYVNDKMNPDEKQVFMDGLDSLIRTLTEAGKKVTFVYAVPLGALPRTCFSRLEIFPAGMCNIDRNTQIQREAGYRSIVKEVLTRYSVTELDPVPWFCPKDNCKVFDNNKIYYLDDSHISRNGGEFFANQARYWFLKNETNELTLQK
jgi:peptidoglycan/LPS O-acetylase OafA/YrhL